MQDGATIALNALLLFLVLVYAVQGGVALLAIVLALLLGPRGVAWAGGGFFLIGPLCGLHGWWRGRTEPARPKGDPAGTGTAQS